MTLKGQGHHTWYELLEHKQSYNHTKFQRPALNNDCQKAEANVKVFAQSENKSIISFIYV